MQPTQSCVWHKDCTCTAHTWRKLQEKNRKEKTLLAGSDNTASMIKGGGYVGARARQPPTAQTV